MSAPGHYQKSLSSWATVCSARRADSRVEVRLHDLDVDLAGAETGGAIVMSLGRLAIAVIEQRAGEMRCRAGMDTCAANR